MCITVIALANQQTFLTLLHDYQVVVELYM